MGAVAEGGEVFVDPQIVSGVEATDEDVRAVVAVENAEIEERCRRSAAAAPRRSPEGR